MYSREYINTIPDATSIAVDPVADPTRIYDISREGIGIKQEGGSVEDITVDAYAFARKGINPSPGTISGQYHIMISLTGGVAQSAVTEIGPNIIAGYFYFFEADGDSVGYMVQSGDTVTDVRDGIISAINSHVWDDPVTASINAANRIDVLIADTATAVACGISTEVYKTGFYTEFSSNGGPVKQYIIELNTANDDYPVLNPIGTSYLYSDLIYAPGGIQSVTDVPGSYTWDAFTPTFEDTITIEDAPGLTLPPAGRCFYHDGTIYFGAPVLSIGERIKMIVI